MTSSVDNNQITGLGASSQISNPRKRIRFVDPLHLIPFQFQIVAQNNLSERNVIWLNEKTYEAVFGQTIGNGAKYLRISNRVFEVACLAGILDNFLGISEKQKMGFNKAIYPVGQAQQLSATVFGYDDQSACSEFKSLTFSLSRPYSAISDVQPVVVSCNDLRQKIHGLYKNQYFQPEQALMLQFPWGCIKAQITGTFFTDNKMTEFGKLSRHTELDFSVAAVDKLTVVSQVFQEQVKRYCFGLSLKKIAGSNAAYAPVKLSYEDIKEKIKTKIANLCFFKGHKLSLGSVSGWAIEAKFTHANLLKSAQEDQGCYQVGYKMSAKPDIHLTVDSTEAVLTKGRKYVAANIHFKIVHLMDASPDKEANTFNEKWISQSEFERAIRELKGPFSQGENFAIDLSSGRYLVKVLSILNKDGSAAVNKAPFAEQRSVGKTTSISLSAADSLSLQIFENSLSAPVKKMKVRVDLEEYLDQEDVQLSKEELCDIFYQYSPNKLMKKQYIEAYTEEGDELTFKVLEMELKQHDLMQDKKASFGYLTDNTEIDFIPLTDATKLSVIDRVYSSEIESLKFVVDLKKQPYAASWEKPPVHLRVESFCQSLKDKLMEQNFILEGQEYELKDTSGWTIIAEFKKGKLKKEYEKQVVTNSIEHPRMFNGYEVGSDTNLKITAQKVDNILLTEDRQHTAASLSLRVEKIEENYAQESSKALQGTWICLSELKQKLLETKVQFCQSDKLTVELQSGKFVLEVVKARLGSDQAIKSVYHPSWRVDENSKISISAPGDLQVKFVETQEEKQVKKVIVYAKQPLAQPNRFQQMFGIDPEPPEPISVEESELKRLFSESMPKFLIQGQELHTKTGRAQPVIFTIVGLDGFDEETNLVKKTFLGVPSKDLEITFEEPPKPTVTIEKPLAIEGIKDPIEHLKTLGLGGINKEFEQMQRIFYMRMPKLKAEALKRGLKAPRGMLLYGPPGTGKTSIAREIGAMLGCSGERLKLITATEVLNKFVGESEKNIRKLFEPAQKAQEKLRDNSPLYVLIIDEIDSILQKRGSTTNGWGDKLVNQFLGALDGLKSLNNLLVIGLTNRKDVIDSAALRPGRFELHIEMGLPKAKGRKEIFEIYLKKLEKVNLLAKDVDIDQLAERTFEFSGADIEAVVKKANLFAMERMVNIPEDEFATSSVGVVTVKDLNRAIGEIKAQKDTAGGAMSKEVQNSIYT